MNTKITSLILMAALVAPGTGGWTDEINATGNNNDPLKHPINAYTNHEVKEDMKESQENGQKAMEAKATYQQAKSDYEKSLKDNGAASPVTQDAKKRMQTARKDMNRFNTKKAKANKELREDEMKSHS